MGAWMVGSLATSSAWKPGGSLKVLISSSGVSTRGGGNGKWISGFTGPPPARFGPVYSGVAAGAAGLTSLLWERPISGKEAQAMIAARIRDAEEMGVRMAGLETKEKTRKCKEGLRRGAGRDGWPQPS